MKVSICLPVRVLPLSLTETALLPALVERVAPIVLSTGVGFSVLSPTLMVSKESWASAGEVIASEDSASSTS